MDEKEFLTRFLRDIELNLSNIREEMKTLTKDPLVRYVYLNAKAEVLKEVARHVEKRLSEIGETHNDFNR